MNIVYLVGNGFDCNLGLDTRYCDYYEWYKSLPDDEQNSKVVSFIEYVKEQEKVCEEWKDMEFALGKYTKELPEENIELEFESLHDAIVRSLSKFIIQQSSKLVVDDNVIKAFCDYFKHPEKRTYFKPSFYDELLKYRNDLANSNFIIDIISFNYSDTIERVVDYKKGKNLGAYLKNGKGVTSFGVIEHIHGSIHDLIVGVNDESQIASKALLQTRGIDFLIKPKCNEVCGEGQDFRCMQLINKADLICVFGCALGASDKRWRDSIIKRISSSNARLIIFNYNPDIDFDSYSKVKREHYLDDIKDYFYKNTPILQGLQDAKKRTYIAHNTGMFKLP